MCPSLEGSRCSRDEVPSFPSGEHEPLDPFLSEEEKQFYSKQENSARSTKFLVFLSARFGNECNGHEMKPGLVGAAEVQEQLAKQKFDDSTSSSACFTLKLAGSCHS